MEVFEGGSTRCCGLERMKYVLLAAAALFMLAACQASFAPFGNTDNSTFDAGSNLIGEACRVVPSQSSLNEPGVRASLNVFCGKWDKPSAKIFVVKSDKDPMELATRGWWRNRLEAFARCARPRSTGILHGVHAVAIDCKLRPGGWPYQALAVRIGNNSYLADSIPASYAVVERAIGVLSGKLARSGAVAAGPRSAEIKRLEATARYSAGDLDSYRRLLWIGQYYNFQGNYAEAEKCYKQAMEIERKLAPGGAGDQCFLCMHIALELSNQERFNLAAAMFDRAASLVGKSVDPAIEEARLTGYRAIDRANRGKKKEALELARKATAMRRELAEQYGYRGGTSSEALQFSSLREQTGMAGTARGVINERAATVFGDLVQSLTVEAAMLTDLRQLDRADHALDEAARVLAEEPLLPKYWLCQVKLLRARIAELRGAWHHSQTLILSAIDIQRSLYTDSRNEGFALLELGRVYMAQGHSQEAFDSFKKGFDIVNKAQAPVSIGEAGPFFELCLKEAKANPGRREKIFEQMFEVAQMVRGSIVAQTMAMTVARLSAGNDAAGKAIRNLQDARYARDKTLEALTYAQVNPRTLSVQIDALQKKYAALNRKVDDLEREVQAAAPTYNQILDRKVQARAVMSVLRPNEALSLILLAQKRSFVFFVNHKSITAYKTELTKSQTDKIVQEMRRAVEPTDRLLTFPVGDAYTLYKKLFGPVEARLAKVEHLIYVPSGPLLSMPFGVLVVAPPGTFTRTYYSEIQWMALHHALTLAPSVQSFVNLRSTVRPAPAQSPFIGFGDFVPLRESTQTFLKALDMPESCRDEAAYFIKATWNKLPNSATELRDVATALGAPKSSLVLGDAFSAAGVEKTNLDKYKIVYFSTHGLLPSRLKCFREPALIVSKGTGLLTTSQIARLKMNADLVVLSACDSGGPAGRNGGQALSGLARSFFYAGARSMLVSQWELLDKPSAQLLTKCFTSVATRNLSFAQALREGQTALIKNPATSHPMIWGALCLVGDGGEHLSGVTTAKR